MTCRAKIALHTDDNKVYVCGDRVEVKSIAWGMEIKNKGTIELITDTHIHIKNKNTHRVKIDEIRHIRKG